MTRRIALALAIAACLTLFTACQQSEPELIVVDTPDSLQPEQAPEQPTDHVIDPESVPEGPPPPPEPLSVPPVIVSHPAPPMAVVEVPDVSSPTLPPASYAPPVSPPPTTSSEPPVVSPVSSAPEITYNPDGSYGFIGGGGSSSSTGMGKREPEFGGHTLEQAQGYLAYAKEYAESIGLVWSESSKDGGHEPAVSFDTLDVEAAIRYNVDYVKRIERTHIYAVIESDAYVQNEYQIIIYR